MFGVEDVTGTMVREGEKEDILAMVMGGEVKRGREEFPHINISSAIEVDIDEN